MNKIKKPFIIAVFIAIALAFFFLFNKQDTPLEQITLQLKWKHQAQFGSFYAADQMNYYADEGLDVTIIPKGDTDEVTSFFDNDIEFGVTGGDSLIVERSKGRPIKAIATVYQRTPTILFAKKTSGIENPQDFLGKTVGIQSGANTETSYRSMMKLLDIDTTDIKEVPVRFDLTPFYEGEVDVFPGYVINEPIEAVQAGYEINLIHPDDYGVEMYGDVIFTSDELIDRNPELVMRFLRASIKGMQYAIEHPSETAEFGLFYDDQLDLAHEKRMMEASIPLIHTGEQEIGWMRSSTWTLMQNTLLEQEVQETEINVNDIFTLEFLEEILQY